MKGNEAIAAEAIEEFGSWMMVRRNPKARFPRKEGNLMAQEARPSQSKGRVVDQPVPTMTRFAALAEILSEKQMNVRMDLEDTDANPEISDRMHETCRQMDTEVSEAQKKERKHISMVGKKRGKEKGKSQQRKETNNTSLHNSSLNNVHLVADSNIEQGPKVGEDSPKPKRRPSPRIHKVVHGNISSISDKGKEQAHPSSLSGANKGHKLNSPKTLRTGRMSEVKTNTMA